MWFAMFFIMGLGFVASLAQLRTDSAGWDHRAEAAVHTGLIFGLLGLATGSLWARWTWGAWWVSDPQLNGALVTVLLYSGYLILRAAMGDDDRVGRLAAVYNVFAFVMLVILLMVLPRYTESLHPGKDGNPGFNSYDLDNSLRAVFYPAVIGWGVLCYWMYTLRLRMNRLAYRLLTQ
jgi:heme exporter protein C